MKILLFGKNGQLGKELTRLPWKGELVALGRLEANFLFREEISNVIQSIQPDIIINAVAYTNVDLAEKEKILAYQINTIAPSVIAKEAKKQNSIYVHFSTDYVFDGEKRQPYTEQDAPNPINVYGKTKLNGERIIQDVDGVYLIFRTSWVYNLTGNNFVTKILKSNRLSEKIFVVNDQFSSPTWTYELAFSVFKILNQVPNTEIFSFLDFKKGIYNLSNIGVISRYDWAKEIIALDKHHKLQSANKIVPVTSDFFKTDARRPPFSSLSIARFEDTFKFHPDHWKDALQKAMDSAVF